MIISALPKLQVISFLLLLVACTCSFSTSYQDVHLHFAYVTSLRALKDVTKVFKEKINVKFPPVKAVTMIFLPLLT